MGNQSSNPPPAGESGRSAQRPGLDPQRRWRDYIEDQIAEARDRGAFDNLEGAGQPLQLEKNIHAGEKALAYSLLKNNQMAPPEIERGKEIDSALARAETLLATLRHRRESLRLKLGGAFASDRRAYNLVRDNTEVRYAQMLREINGNILSLNIIAPSALHRRPLDVAARLRAFAEEFPRLPE
jgi:DnaJ family protein C protein 28